MFVCLKCNELRPIQSLMLPTTKTAHFLVVWNITKTLKGTSQFGNTLLHRIRFEREKLDEKERQRDFHVERLGCFWCRCRCQQEVWEKSKRRQMRTGREELSLVVYCCGQRAGRIGSNLWSLGREDGFEGYRSSVTKAGGRGRRMSTWILQVPTSPCSSFPIVPMSQEGGASGAGGQVRSQKRKRLELCFYLAGLPPVN